MAQDRGVACPSHWRHCCSSVLRWFLVS